MITIETDSNNDIVRSPDGNVSFIRGIDATAQTASHFAQTRLGEMIHDIPNGVPFFELVFGANLRLPQFETAQRERILQAPDVTNVPTLESTQTDGILRYTATIETVNGVAEINGTL